MKKIIASVSTLAFLVIGLPVAAASDNGITPYIGMDAKWYHMPFKKGFGDNLTKSNYPQGNAFFGVKLNEFLGVEAGYAAAGTKTRNAILRDGSTLFGQLVEPDPITGAPTPAFGTTTQTKLKGFNVNLVGFLPVSEEYALDVIAAVGVSHLKLRITHDAVYGHREFSKEKWIPRLNLGVQHMIAKQFGVRATVGWEKTSNFGDLTPTNVTSSFIAKVKDSTSLGLGLFYNFK